MAFDGEQMTAHIAGTEWITIQRLAEEIAGQLNVEVELGKAVGEEVIIDPEVVIPNWQPAVSLGEGIAMVIADARQYLKQA